MQSDAVLSWQAHEYDFREKESSWYWAVAIVAVGSAVAAFILSDYLFAIIAVIAGFTVMLVGSKKPKRHTYQITTRGLLIGKRLIPFQQMVRFAIHDEEPRALMIETNTFAGTISVPLADADYRVIQMELKNRDIEEVDSLHSLIDHVARGIGL